MNAAEPNSGFVGDFYTGDVELFPAFFKICGTDQLNKRCEPIHKGIWINSGKENTALIRKNFIMGRQFNRFSKGDTNGKTAVLLFGKIYMNFKSGCGFAEIVPQRLHSFKNRRKRIGSRCRDREGCSYTASEGITDIGSFAERFRFRVKIG